jgi:hypothetical protein
MRKEDMQEKQTNKTERGNYPLLRKMAFHKAFKSIFLIKQQLHLDF